MSIAEFWRQFNIKMATFYIFPSYAFSVYEAIRKNTTPVYNESHIYTLIHVLWLISILWRCIWRKPVTEEIQFVSNFKINVVVLIHRLGTIDIWNMVTDIIYLMVLLCVVAPWVCHNPNTTVDTYSTVTSNLKPAHTCTCDVQYPADKLTVASTQWPSKVFPVSKTSHRLLCLQVIEYN